MGWSPGGTASLKRVVCLLPPFHYLHLATYAHTGPFDFSAIGFKAEFVKTAIDRSR